ncbi:hypothetical protein OROMI_003040 [Orobanche minor]
MASAIKATGGQNNFVFIAARNPPSSSHHHHPNRHRILLSNKLSRLRYILIPNRSVWGLTKPQNEPESHLEATFEDEGEE